MRTIFFLSLFITTQVCAQDFSLALRRLKVNYASLEHFRVTVCISEYGASTDAYPSISREVDVVRDHGSWFWQQAGKTSLLNDSCFMEVDHNKRVIVYWERTAGDDKLMSPIAICLDSVLSFYAAKSGDSESHNEVDLQLGGDENDFIEKILFHYSDGREKQITFNDFNVDASFPVDLFDERNFIDRYHLPMLPAEPFKDYRMVVFASPY